DRCRSFNNLQSYYRVAPNRFAKPHRAELRCTLLRFEIHVDEPEPVAESIHPLKVVLRAPEEVPMYRHTVDCRPLKLRQVSAQEHDPVGIVHLAIFGDYVRCSATVLSDENRLCAPERLHMVRSPVQSFGIEDVPGRLHFWMRCIHRNFAVSRLLV